MLGLKLNHVSKESQVMIDYIEAICYVQHANACGLFYEAS